MVIMGMNHLGITVVAMVLMFLDDNVESSNAFRGILMEKIGKLPRKIVHSIEVKSQFATLPTLRDPIIMNRRPGEQILQNDTDVTIGCLRGWKEPDCQTCAHGWREPDCDAFAPNFGPPGQCDRCKTGWAGDNCDSCDHGWTGPKCNACEFGFSTESRCTECIQNGHWSGNYYTIPMTAELTFEGSACTKLASGSYIIYSRPYHDYITGDYDNATGILTTMGDPNAFNAVGNVNVSDKSIIGALLGGHIPFTLTYQG